MSTPIHYEVGWTDSGSFLRCYHVHETLIDAAQCGLEQRAGWYVFAVENGTERELTTAEDKIVNDFRFAKRNAARA